MFVGAQAQILQLYAGRLPEDVLPEDDSFEDEGMGEEACLCVQSYGQNPGMHQQV